MYNVQGNEFTAVGEIYNVKQSQKVQNAMSGSMRINNTGNAQNDYVNVIDYNNNIRNLNIQTNDVVMVFGYINQVGVHIIQAIMKFGHIQHKQKNNNYQGNNRYNQGNNGYNQSGSNQNGNYQC